MADLTGTTPANTYKGLLQVNDYTDGIAGNTGSNALVIQDGAGNATALAISTDNVGIGTTSPDTALHISTTSPSIRLTDTTPATNTVSQVWADSDAVGALLLAADITNVGTDPFISARIGGLGSSDEKMRIDSDGNVGIGTASPSAPLEVSSTTGGVIMPRMTTTQRNAIASPANGEMVYDTDLNKFYGYANNAWTALH